ncbi:SprB repeat-containing protein [bacterium]|nr:SprB repeat-containing protein [bacterium]
MKLKGIDGGPHKRWSMWFNSMIREEPYHEELILTLIDSITFNVSCFGKNDGQIGLEASGGVPPYSYSILGDLTQESNIIDALFADTFVVACLDVKDELNASIAFTANFELHAIFNTSMT